MARRNRTAAFRKATLPSRGGFTLIELLVALVLLDIGLLALVGLGATLARAANATSARFLGTTLASARLERLASTSCSGPVAGKEQVGNAAVESYSDVPQPNGTRRLTDSVVVTISRGVQVVVLSTGGRC
jgi:Tfp pilus assembly protein PilV